MLTVQLLATTIEVDSSTTDMKEIA